MDKDHEQRILDFAKKGTQYIVTKFSSKADEAVFFDDFNALGVDIETDISKGCFVTLPINDADLKIINCRMDEGAVLDAHHHPDYYEKFKIKKGKMRDRVTGKVYHSGDTVTFNINQTHTPEAITDLEMLIVCTPI